MPVTITITADDAHTAQAEIERILRGWRPKPVVIEGPPPVGVHVPSPPVQTPYAHEVTRMEERAAGETVIVDMPPEPKKRGRPKGSTATVLAEQAAEAAPAQSLDYVVRRYGGETDSEHPTAQSAMARLIELVGAAADLQALDELVDANGDLVEALRQDDWQKVEDAVSATRTALTPAAPEPAPAAPVWPLRENGEPLTVVTPDRQGARDVVMALATGAPPKFGHSVAFALLERHGVGKLSEITDDADPRLQRIAVDGAGVLGLKVVGMTAPASGGLL